MSDTSSATVRAHTHVLPPLVIGNCVRLQNMVGPHQPIWDRTLIVVEVRQFDQCIVRVDGSGRVTLRNRKYLRLYMPHIARAPLIYSSSVIPIAMTVPPAPIQPDAPTPSTPPQSGLDGPASTTTGPTISRHRSGTRPELLPNDHAITELSPGPHPTFSDLSATPLQDPGAPDDLHRDRCRRGRTR